MSERILRLYPPPTTEVGTPYEDLELPPPGGTSSPPYVAINMVSSIDGRVNSAGRASRLGSALDRRVMRALRSKADAVMIGAGTLRAERLSLGLDETSTGPQPLGVIISRSGEVPLQTNLVANAGQEVLILVPEGEGDGVAGSGKRIGVPVNALGSVDLEKALRLLYSEFGVEVLLVEGGPSLNHALITLDLADELFLTIAPKLLGGKVDEALTILDGPEHEPRDMCLLSLHLVGDELFLRYSLDDR